MEQPTEAETNYKIYERERSIVEGRISDQRSEFDRQLVNISTWAFGLTLVYYGSIHQKQNIEPCFLFAGLGLLILTILFVLISFQLSNKALRDYLNRIEDDYVHNKDVDWKKRTLSHTLTVLLNRFSIGSFILGLTSIFIFLIQTIKKG